MKNKYKNNPRRNAPRMIILSFLITILAGTVLLFLPFSTTAPGCMNILDALFTSTSAVCVTGLIVVDTGTFFTPFGQGVILALIQIGGLGIMTMSTFFLIMLRKRLSLKDRLLLQDAVGQNRIQGLKSLIKMIVVTTILVETAGAVLIAWRLRQAYGYPLSRAVVYGIFHSISAFCNAGFSLYRDSIMRFGADWWITLTMGILIFLGGIGFLIWYNLTHFYFWRRNRLKKGRVRLQTKLALAVSGIFIVAMVCFLLATEWNNTLSSYPLGEKLSRTLFQSITPRTAGFNTLPVNKLEPESLWFTNFMMFVGASPSSTGGGIKTTTFAVLLAAVYAMVTGKKQVVIGRWSIPDSIVYKVLSIVVISATVIFLATTCLLLTESGICRHPGIPRDYLGCLFFETVSAFGTVGLSTGITPYLTFAGKLIIILTMYLGRIGPLAMALWVGSKTHKDNAVRYPEESVIVG